MKIAVINDEINYFNCQYSNVNRCILDEGNNQTMSCVILDYLTTNNYKLVSSKNNKYNFIMKPTFFF